MSVVPFPRERGDAALDARLMQMALAVSRRMMGRTWPNPSVGAVLVRFEDAGPVVVGRGWTAPGGRPHAETEALRRAGEAARGATLYVTLEPCSHHGRTPPCADALIAAGVARVVCAVGDPNPQVGGDGFARLRAAGIIVDTGIGEADAHFILGGHLRRMREQRPQVMLKLAVSADGRIGLAGRRPVAITGPEANARVHLLRAASDAVVTGIGTVLADDPLLTCRLPGMAGRSPVRVVLDTRLRLPLTSRLVNSIETSPVWVVAGEDVPAERAEALRARGLQVFQSPAPGSRLDLGAAFELLAAKGLTRVMVEGGAILSGALAGAGLIDEVLLLRGPGTIGADGIEAVEGMPLAALTAAPRYRLREADTLGADAFEWYERS